MAQISAAIDPGAGCLAAFATSVALASSALKTILPPPSMNEYNDQPTAHHLQQQGPSITVKEWQPGLQLPPPPMRAQHLSTNGDECRPPPRTTSNTHHHEPRRVPIHKPRRTPIHKPRRTSIYQSH
ncbi:uncharacterized protein LACBIDRAFT_321657 [Laccaria bicolor S238N-H82]|uniref:Predicted protein n=1 Tax=Laccaria bicolor (strain S238N-H82 / ATCC MYA-4686) TaxID=486041 RepID=B0CTQ0_LACBS|nr:uncharacterized protein LACBIDRAFT_321657 [Laccaria bicolor S238N-H82]EDR13956.1 predicted protein [Laccaria bicolor S238N-H82]|eukprot:XP_001874515.1 predicted protein [Laccaria bicolor S238N-H82]